jgi:phosphatidylglycerophosphate synthase
VRRYLTRLTVSSEAAATRDAAATVLAGLLVAATAAVGVSLRYSGTGAATGIAVVAGSVPAVLSAGAVLRRRPRISTPADRVTLGRAVLASGCAAVTVLVLAGVVAARTWWFVALIVPTLLLDAVDGLVARRSGSVTRAGAALDMEVDAGVLVILSLAVASVLGEWVLLIGAMRYLFVAASWKWPVLRTPLPRSWFRRLVAGLQGAVLTAALAPAVPVDAARIAVLLALALLVASFGTQIVAIRRTAGDDPYPKDPTLR